jgi:hypothetical protein
MLHLEIQSLDLSVSHDLFWLLIGGICALLIATIQGRTRR